MCLVNVNCDYCALLLQNMILKRFLLGHYIMCWMCWMERLVPVSILKRFLFGNCILKRFLLALLYKLDRALGSRELTRVVGAPTYKLQ
jgi:hypothetical protein